MKFTHFKTLFGSAIAATCLISATGGAAQAGGFTPLNSDWHIVYDSFNDGTAAGNVVGSLSNYEMFGMAAKVEDGQAYFAFNGNLGIEGKDGITYGDLFFNFTDMSFKDASATAKLFAVHFAPNDAGDGSMEYGLYQNVTAKGVAKTNSGHDGFGTYQNRVETSYKDNTPGVASGSHGVVGFGDLAPEEALTYLAEETQMVQIREKVFYEETYMKTVKRGTQWVEEERTRTKSKWVTRDVPQTKLYDKQYSIQNVIASGDWMNDIAMLSQEELVGLDFGTNDPATYAKAQTFGFKLALDKLPEGDALISILHECINDGMAMKANFAALPPSDDSGVSVPEPSSVVSLSLIGLALVGRKLRKRQDA
jgi:hypothetical protein